MMKKDAPFNLINFAIIGIGIFILIMVAIFLLQGQTLTIDFNEQNTSYASWTSSRGNQQLQGVASGPISDSPDLLWTFKAKDAISSLAKSLTNGLGFHTKKESGLGGLFDALNSGKHSRYLDNPSLLGKKDTTKEGNDILGHIFGNKDVSRHVTKRTSKETGLSGSLLKKMLPVVASMVMGALGKKMLGGGGRSRKESTGFLTKIFDRDHDGSMVDDVLGMAFKAFMSR